jgi:hypothetical protein
MAMRIAEKINWHLTNYKFLTFLRVRLKAKIVQELTVFQELVMKS